MKKQPLADIPGKGKWAVHNSDPCTIGRNRFPRLRRFHLLRDAERYATRARKKGLYVEIGLLSDFLARNGT